MGRKVIRVNSDHREQTGGHHVCGYIWLTVTPVGTCAIEKWLDTTTSLGLQLGSDMAWHVQNNAQIGGCTMQTKNAWAPAKPDSYHSCKFTLDVYDLDEYKQEVRYYR